MEPHRCENQTASTTLRRRRGGILLAVGAQLMVWSSRRGRAAQLLGARRLHVRTVLQGKGQSSCRPRPSPGMLMDED